MPAILVDINANTAAASPDQAVSAGNQVTINVELMDGTLLVQQLTVQAEAAALAAEAAALAAQTSLEELNNLWLGIYYFAPPTNADGAYIDKNNTPVQDGSLFYQLDSQALFTWSAASQEWKSTGDVWTIDGGTY